MAPDQLAGHVCPEWRHGRRNYRTGPSLRPLESFLIVHLFLFSFSLSLFSLSFSLVLFLLRINYLFIIDPLHYLVPSVSVINSAANEIC